jgi:hypothetical protein
MADFKNKSVVYPYDSSQPAAVTAAVIFGFLLATHLFKLFKNRTWFCVPFVISAICECALSRLKLATFTDACTDTRDLVANLNLLQLDFSGLAHAYLP